MFVSLKMKETSWELVTNGVDTKDGEQYFSSFVAKCEKEGKKTELLMTGAVDGFTFAVWWAEIPNDGNPARIRHIESMPKKKVAELWEMATDTESVEKALPRITE